MEDTPNKEQSRSCWGIPGSFGPGQLPICQRLAPFEPRWRVGRLHPCWCKSRWAALRGDPDWKQGPGWLPPWHILIICAVSGQYFSPTYGSLMSVDDIHYEFMTSIRTVLVSDILFICDISPFCVGHCPQCWWVVVRRVKARRWHVSCWRLSHTMEDGAQDFSVGKAIGSTPILHNFTIHGWCKPSTMGGLCMPY